MDSSEALVEAFLKSIGFTDVRYEPDGNVPPDFLADGRIAIEVRRLNQNYDDGSGTGPRGLEEKAIPIWNKFRTYLTGLGPASDQSWFVFYSFSRPTPTWKELKCELDAVLVPFMLNPDPRPIEKWLNVGGRFRIKLYKASVPQPTFFLPAGHIDEQAGGWVLSEIGTNLQHCIAEKASKIAKFRAKYPHWWLVLPDHIDYALGDFERQMFFDQCSLDSCGFEKIILLDPRDFARCFQAYPREHSPR